MEEDLEDLQRSLDNLKAERRRQKEEQKLREQRGLSRAGNEDWYAYPMEALCAELHQAVTGSGDPLSPKEFATKTSWLRRRLTHWCEGGGLSLAYDNAVKALAIATLDECDAHQNKAAR